MGVDMTNGKTLTGGSVTQVAEVKTKGHMVRCASCKGARRIEVPMVKRMIYPKMPGQAWMAREAWVVEYRSLRLESCACGASADRQSCKAIQGHYRPEVPCDARCTGAKGHNCECSCNGKNHGSQS